MRVWVLFVLIVGSPQIAFSYNCPPCTCVNILILDRCVDCSDGCFMILKDHECERRCQHYNIIREGFTRHVPRSSPCTDCSSTTDDQYEGWKRDSVGQIVCCPQLDLTIVDTPDGPVCRASSTACDGGRCLSSYIRNLSRLCVSNTDGDVTVTQVPIKAYTKRSQTPASSDRKDVWGLETGFFFGGAFVGASLTTITLLVVLCYHKRCNHGTIVSQQTRSWTASPSEVDDWVDDLQNQILDLQKNLYDVTKENKQYVERITDLEKELKKVRKELQELLKMTKEELSVSHTIYDEEILNKIRPLFVAYVIPGNVLHMFHHYNRNVLVQQDIEIVGAVTSNYGTITGATWLLERLVRYKDWFECLICVLRDPQVKQGHVAEEMLKALGRINDGAALLRLKSSRNTD